MRFPGFIGPSYQLKSINVDCQRCVNLYPELDETGMAKEGSVGSLIGTPGLSSPLVTLATSPYRGSHLASDGTFYVVSGNTLYMLSSPWVSTTVGTLLTQAGPVSMADNGIGGSLFLVDGNNGYTSTLQSTSLTQVTAAGFLGASQVTFQDGYFMFFQPNTHNFFCSDFGQITFNTAGTGTSMQGAKGSYGDPLNGISSFNRNLWLLGTKTTEVWYDAGNPTPGVPFSLIQGVILQLGCAATFSIQQMNNMLFFLGQDQSGQGLVYAVSGYQPAKISTKAVELAIQSYGSLSSATSWSYQENGHYFYGLNFANANTTWVYDVSSGLWHERCYLNQGIFQRSLIQGHTFVFGTHVVGDYQSGNLYQLSSTIYSDNGNPIPRERTFPHLAKDMDRIFTSSLQLDLEPGVGIDGTGQGTRPEAMMQFSNDGGHSWSNELWVSIGAIGATEERAIWRRLGQARDRVYRIRVTDPVKNVWIGAEIELEKGAA